MEKFVEHIKIRLHIMSPVHIGCDDVYEPTNFVIDDARKKLIVFDPLNFMNLLNNKERDELTKIAEKGNMSSIIELYRFISNKKEKIDGRKIDVAESIIKRYSEVKKLSTSNDRSIKQELNKFEINRTAYNPQNNLPYIPGSSIKGALRTGYLSILATCGGDKKELEKTLDDPKYSPANPIKGQRSARAFEEQLLQGSFSTDPFSHVKVSDFLPVENVQTKIGYAVNRKKKESDKETAAENGPPQIFETINSEAVFEGQIIIRQPLTAGIRNVITKKNLLLAAHKHFAGNLSQENKALKNNAIERYVGIKVNNKFKDKLKKQAYLFRVGRHSGAEAVTIEGNRSIKIIQGRGRQPIYLDHATTFWLFAEGPKSNNNLIPFGWAVLEVII